MEIILTRKDFQKNCTIGELEIVHYGFKCFSLEDFDRDLYQKTPLTDIAQQKIHGQTAIPYGRYEVAITYSSRFKKMMPQILDVPGFAGIRIHNGNFAGDTEGCVLLGMDRGEDMIFRSREACTKFLQVVEPACKMEKVYITIQKDLAV